MLNYNMRDNYNSIFFKDVGCAVGRIRCSGKRLKKIIIKWLIMNKKLFGVYFET